MGDLLGGNLIWVLALFTLVAVLAIAIIQAKRASKSRHERGEHMGDGARITAERSTKQAEVDGTRHPT